MPLRLCAAALAVSLLTASPAFAGTHVYLVRGLLGWLVAPMSELNQDLAADGATVESSS